MIGSWGGWGWKWDGWVDGYVFSCRGGGGVVGGGYGRGSIFAFVDVRLWIK